MGVTMRKYLLVLVVLFSACGENYLPKQQALTIGVADVQRYTATGSFTWTPTGSPTFVRVRLFGGGASGGSGGCGPTTGDVTGGGGGGGGAWLDHTDFAMLFGASVSGSVGAGGASVAGITMNNSPGLDGKDGGNTVFGFLISRGGRAGKAGKPGGSTLGGAMGQGMFNGGGGGAAQTTVAGNNGSPQLVAVVGPYSSGPGGGGAGGGIHLGTGHDGGLGGASVLLDLSPANPAGGVYPGGNGQNGTAHTYYLPGTGAGGGAAGDSMNNAGKGGDGAVYGAGGGGGGADLDGSCVSGASGKGADGMAEIISW